MWALRGGGGGKTGGGNKGGGAMARMAAEAARPTRTISAAATTNASRPRRRPPPEASLFPREVVPSPLLSAAALAELRRRRVVAVDHLPAATIRAAAAEVRELLDGGLMRNDPTDVCNPGAMQFELPLQDADHAGFAREFPGLGACRQAIFSLPHELQSGLGDDLPPMRVPQTLLLAAYPKGASYRRHFDSYAGRDIPRLLTVLLYLAWEPATGGHLRVSDPTTPEAAASERIIMRGREAAGAAAAAARAGGRR